MTTPSFTMRQLLEAGVHFGHKTRRWNPKVASYLYGSRDGIHIIDLRQTVPMLHHALEAVTSTVSEGGKVLFVGTKRQAAPIVKASAELCGQYFVNHRWLGGMLTNWNTVSQSITRLNEMDEQLKDGLAGFTKKEALQLNREREKLEKTLGGIREMGGVPDVVFVLDTMNEDIAIKEANKLGIPVIAIVDSNSNPDGVDYIIPGNDDATRAIELYCNLISAAVLAGLQTRIGKRGGDAGEAAEVVVKIKEGDAKKSAPKKATEAKAEAVEEKAPAKKAPAKAKIANKDEEKKAAPKKPAAKAAPKKTATKK